MTETTPLTLGRAWDLTDRLLTAISRSCPDIQTLEPAGELRRAEPLVGAIVIVGCADNPAAAIDGLKAGLDLQRISIHLPSTLVAVFEQTAIEVVIVPREEFGGALLAATGPEAHVRELFRRGLADRRYSTEADVYASVGLPFVPPELRKGVDEINAAAAGRLPALLETSAIRGDLHMHTVYSDGRDSVAAMIDRCAALGYQYAAITDHSAGASASRTLAIDAIARQRDEIAVMREKYPRMRILHGVEVDIRPDSRLDFPDAVLQQFDIVLASLHERDGHSPRQLTRRSLDAIHHPLVNILCHPANRLVGRSPGYALDFDAIYEAAAATGTALEVDGAPSHMDLDGERARAAVAAGAVLVVDSDSHRADALARQMRFGVCTARRGWVEAHRVLNTRPIEQLLVFIAAKRSR